MKAYWINATERTVTEVEYAGLKDLQRMVGGYIEAAKQWPTKDVLYVDEDGLLKQPTAHFTMPGLSNPIGSNGVVVGREIGDTADTADPKMTIEQIRAEVRFLSDTQVKSWAAAHSSEPFLTLHTLDGKSETLRHVGEAFRAAPPKR